MNKVVSLMILSLFLVSFASAYTYYEDTHYDYYDNGYTYKEKYTATKYYPQEDITLTVTKYRDYDNEKRFSTEVYRHGYSYRNTKNYFEDYVTHRSPEAKYDYQYSKKNYPNSKPERYTRYIPYLKTYEEFECYTSPPSGKLFYIKCP